jgi:hypothetical protein
MQDAKQGGGIRLDRPAKEMIPVPGAWLATDHNAPPQAAGRRSMAAIRPPAGAPGARWMSESAVLPQSADFGGEARDFT